ncbi:hypothetical protein NSK_005517 [Nannochloropsis salina CCMP1776]|uniref:DWNN domain-containing protein n=1 Tax=Nannochloropsis salina CCMP1776 TaxID=1027361 RepID=A0A4D9CVA9_9STRA|nr:hypothetical protein NSK_005517 [Nannochloropsis salina CCMP1776]|eukprot:TFJ83182.1 hypothetical protein NSK_005517 [Nannochloropsis salina CCMP1776]
MASVIHYRFKTATETNSLRFDGQSLRVFDIKAAIVAEKRLDKGLDFDLELSNPQSKEVYVDETKMIAKNSTVLVKRVAAPRGSAGLLARLRGNTPLTPQNMAGEEASPLDFDPPAHARASVGWAPPQTIVVQGKGPESGAPKASTPPASVSKPPTPTAVKAEGKEEKEGPEKEGEEKNGEGGPAGPRARRWQAGAFLQPPGAVD